MQLRSYASAAIVTRNIAAQLGKTQTDLSRVQDSLINDPHLLRAGARDEVQFVVRSFGAWLEEQLHRPNEPEPADGEVRRARSSSRRTRLTVEAPPRLPVCFRPEDA